MATTYTGPTYTNQITQQGITGASFVQETLIIVVENNVDYALLGHTPIDPFSLKIFHNGSFLRRTNDYTVDGRKVQFNAALSINPASDVVVADYITVGNVAAPAAVTIDFDVPNQNVRFAPNGRLQILINTTWHDMLSVTNPITGDVTFVPDQSASSYQS
jgi:hypothetical protein